MKWVRDGCDDLGLVAFLDDDLGFVGLDLVGFLDDGLGLVFLLDRLCDRLFARRLAFSLAREPGPRFLLRLGLGMDRP